MDYLYLRYTGCAEQRHGTDFRFLNEPMKELKT
jgi:hypothetical protein